MRIGNPQDGAGDVLITGISAVSAGSTISTGITAIEGGSSVTLSVPSSGVISISVDLSGVSSAISSKMNKPSSFGSSGQVLKTNGTGGTYWDDAGVASVTWESIGGKPSSVNALPSEVGSNGALLTAGANGTMRWEAPATAVSYDNGKAVAASAVYNHVSAHANNGRHLPSPMGNQNCVLVVNSNGTQYVLSSAVAFASSAAHATSAGSVDWNNVSNRPTLVTMSSVQSLPTSEIHDNVIYLVPSENSSVNNAKDEYIRQNGAWERIGTTEISAEAYDSHIADSTIHVPAFTVANNGQALKVVDGSLAWGSAGTGDGLPAYGAQDSGKTLQVDSTGTTVEWVARPYGDMTVAAYVNENGNGIVRSAVTADSAMSVSATQVAGLESAVRAVHATSSTFGTVRIGAGIGVNDGVISVTGGGSVVVDASLSPSSENPVQNRAIWSGMMTLGLMVDGLASAVEDGSYTETPYWASTLSAFRTWWDAMNGSSSSEQESSSSEEPSSSEIPSSSSSEESSSSSEQESSSSESSSSSEQESSSSSSEPEQSSSSSEQESSSSSTPSGAGYLITGFPSIDGADYSSYNGLYTDTGNTVNGKPIYQNVADNYLYRYYFSYNEGDEEEPYIISGAGWVVHDSLSLAEGADSYYISYEAKANGYPDSPTPSEAQYWNVGEEVSNVYSNAYENLYGDYPPAISITCTLQSQ